LPLSCTIQTEQDSSPDDDEMGPSAGQTLMEKIDQMEGLDMELSGTMSNTDCAPPTEEDAMMLKISGRARQERKRKREPP
jgi:hypothetical protein